MWILEFILIFMQVDLYDFNYLIVRTLKVLDKLSNTTFVLFLVLWLVF